MLYQPGFELLPSEEVCPNKGIDLNVMILVISGSNNAVYREEIRSTWGKIAARHDASLAFIVGISKNNTVNQIIEEENVLYGDIIQVRVRFDICKKNWLINDFFLKSSLNFF